MANNGLYWLALFPFMLVNSWGLQRLCVVTTIIDPPMEF